MTVRFLCVLPLLGGVLATACRAGNPSGAADGATVAPADQVATPTAGPVVTVQETAVPATSTPTLAPTSMPSPTAGSEEGEADANVLFVQASQEPDGSWTFGVTVSHPDTGWDDYADGWDVVTPEGTVLKPNPDDAFTRVLLHPHENEQPFTRSQRGIVIPNGVTTITVRAHDSVDGFGGREVQVDLEAASGSDFEVERQP